MAPKKPNNNKGKEKKIAVEEADLWQRISSSVKPISAESQNRAFSGELPELENKNESAKTAKSENLNKSSKKIVLEAPKKKLPQGPQLTGINRRSKQKLLRGNVDIDARLDLHGSSQMEARGILRNFLASSQKRGANMVLVITGKGASPYTRHILHGHEDYNTPEREGVLRQKFPEWMRENTFSEFISGFQPAHPKHGGGGAFYVKLRKLKK